ncbi:MAG: sigma-E factor negative regulatory protein [Gammaproteobacteria bacterium]|nr:sigma-E factor negative regulatory protein [Gammaproteobacteria bacterium]
MNDNKREQLSALMDGEAKSHECDDLVKSLCQHDSKEEQGCWQRYHLISDALKKNLPDNLQHDLSRRVSAALVDEPTVLAPRRFTINWKRYSKPLAGVAIAASVATFSIVGLRVVLPEISTVNSVAAINDPATPQLQSQDFTTVADSLNIKPPLQFDDKATRLNGYLVNHSEFSSPNGMQVLPPYMRVVGQAFEQSPAQE